MSAVCYLWQDLNATIQFQKANPIWTTAWQQRSWEPVTLNIKCKEKYKTECTEVVNEQLFGILADLHTLTCVGPGMQDRTLSMFSEVTSTSSTATSTSPEHSTQEKDIYKTSNAAK